MAKDVCGHENKHSPKPYLTCILAKEHDGNHKAVGKVKATQMSGVLGDTGKYKSIIEDGTRYYVGDVESEWSDIAGIPASEIKPNSPGVEVIDSKKQQEWLRDEKIDELQGKLDDMEKRFAALEAK